MKLIVLQILFFIPYSLCEKNETKKEENRQFLFNRPQISQLNGGGLTRSPFGPLLGSSLNLGGLSGLGGLGGLGASQSFPNSFISRTGPSGISGSNPFLGGFGLGSGLQNPLLGQGGLGNPSGINNPLLGLNNLRNPLLGGFGSLTPGNDFTGGNLQQNGQLQLLLRQLQNGNQLNGLNNPFAIPRSLLQQNQLNQRDLFARRQLDQMNEMKRLGLFPVQQLPTIDGNPSSRLGSSEQKSAEEELMELRILQYILGNDGLKGIIGRTGQTRGRDTTFDGFRSGSSRSTFPSRGPLSVTTARRLDTSKQ